MSKQITVYYGNQAKTYPFEEPVRLDRLTAGEPHGPATPCGGRGACLKCRVRAEGELSPLTRAEREGLTPEEIAGGVRLACQCMVTGSARVWVEQSGRAMIQLEGKGVSAVLAPWAKGLGLAVDVGTTTLAAYLYRLKDGVCLGRAARLNPQGSFGADVLARMEASVGGHAEELARSVREGIAGLRDQLCRENGCSAEEVEALCIVGNTAMEYLLEGRDPNLLMRAPFTMEEPYGRFVELPGLGRVYLARCLSAYVGGDITGAVLSQGLYRGGRVQAEKPVLLCDIGTNGEMALAAGEEILCCSTAAGPALEGAGIHQGMTAQEGAIDRVWLEDGKIRWHAIGGGKARGICGSGLVDAVAALLEAELIDETGRLTPASGYEDLFDSRDGKPSVMLGDSGVILTQGDVRSVQLCKAAICAGMETLMQRAGIEPHQVERLIIAGGFGSKIDPASAQRIGLIPPGFAQKAEAVGNAAGLGASLMLLNQGVRADGGMLPSVCRTLDLGPDPVFMDLYVENMGFDSDA